MTEIRWCHIGRMRERRIETTYPRNQDKFVQFSVWVFDPDERKLHSPIVEFQFVQTARTCFKKQSSPSARLRATWSEAEVSHLCPRT